MAKRRAAAAPAKTYLTDGHKEALAERVRIMVVGPLGPDKQPLDDPRPFTDRDRERLADEYADALMLVAHVYDWTPEDDRAPAHAEVLTYLEGFDEDGART